MLYLMFSSGRSNAIKRVLCSGECHRSPLVHHRQYLKYRNINEITLKNEKAQRTFPSRGALIVAEKCIKLKYSSASQFHNTH